MFWTSIMPKVKIMHTCLHSVTYLQLSHCQGFSWFKIDFCCWWKTRRRMVRWWGSSGSSSSSCCCSSCCRCGGSCCCCCTCCCISITVTTEKLISSVTKDKTVIWTDRNPIDSNWSRRERGWSIVTGRCATPWRFEVCFATCTVISISWTVWVVCELKK